jgi:putative ABC transport system permease protein
MLRLAFRNLTRGMTRLVVSTGGVALALTLMLVLNGIVGGAERQITAWIDHSGADIIVSQAGVRTMHMSSSALPTTAADAVSAIPGVAKITPVLYVSNMLASGSSRSPVYVIGLPDDATMGLPWSITDGVARPADGQTVIDRRVARGAGIALGDPVVILGQPFTVAGLADGTTNIVNSIVFITARDFARLRGSAAVASYLLVRVGTGPSAGEVARAIEAAVPGVTAQTRAAFAGQERRLVRDMATDLIQIMNLIGFVIALAVTALTVYTATFARRHEYGVLKALGAGNQQLYRVVLQQALISVTLALAAALAVALALEATLPRLGPNLPMLVEATSATRVALVALAVAALSSVLPIRQIARLDPAMVYRSGGPR